MCLKQSFSYSKWIFQDILSLSVLANRVSDNSNFDTVFLPDIPSIIVWFFRLLDRQFNEDSKNVPKTVIFLLQVGFPGYFVPDCSFKLCF